VPVLVIGIGGLVGNPHGKERYQGGDQVQSGVCRFRQNSQRAGGDADDDFQAGDDQSRQHGAPATARFSRRIDPELKWLESLHNLYYRFGCTRRQPLPPLLDGGGTCYDDIRRNYPLEELIHAFPAPCVSFACQLDLRPNYCADYSAHRRNPGATERSRRARQSPEVKIGPDDVVITLKGFCSTPV